MEPTIYLFFSHFVEKFFEQFIIDKTYVLYFHKF